MKHLLGMERRGMIIALKGSAEKRVAVERTFIESGLETVETLLDNDGRGITVFKALVKKSTSFNEIERNGAEIAAEAGVEINYVYFNGYKKENSVNLSFGSINDQEKVEMLSQDFNIPEQEALLRECYQLVIAVALLNDK